MLFAVAALSLVLLIGSVMNGVFLGWPMTVMILLFLWLSRRNGHSWRELAGLLRKSLRRCLPIIVILALVGAMTALWMACGTVGTLVYYSIGLIKPTTVVFWGFVLCCAMSYLLGSTIGTLGAIGVPLLVLARSGGVDPLVMSGALLSGSYFGDKTSPVSSVTALYGTITGTDHYANSRAMLRSSAVPTLLSAVGFAVLSRANPMQAGRSAQILTDLGATYVVGFWALLPALVLLGLCLVRVPVRPAMGAAILAAAGVALLVQGRTPGELLQTVAWGYRLPAGHPLAGVLGGGGLLPALKTFYIVMLSCAAGDLAEQGGLLPPGIGRWVKGGRGRTGLFLRTLAVTLVSGTWGCGQIAAIVVTSEMMWPVYRERGLPSAELVRDLGNTGYLIFALVPWATSFINPSLALGITGMGHLPYALFLYISPLYCLVHCLLVDFRDRRRRASVVTTEEEAT